MATQAYPEYVKEELGRLRERIQASGIPPKGDRNLIVGSWNIRNFGRVYPQWEENPGSPKRNRRALAVIAEIVRQFDVVAIQEVRQDTSGIRQLIEQLGPDWDLILSDVAEGDQERLAFLYDQQRVRPSGLAGEIVLPETEMGTPLNLFVRPPYQVGFQIAGERFVLLVALIRYDVGSDRRTEEATALAEHAVDEIRERAGAVGSAGKNVLLLGDFSIARWGEHPLLQAFVSRGLYVPSQLQGLPTIFKREPKFQSQIGWFMDAENTLRFDDRGGAIDFVGAVFEELSPAQISYRVSDHLPLWVEFGLHEEPAGLAEQVSYPEGQVAAVMEALRPTYAINDRPLGPDRLGFDQYADAFAQILGNPDTRTPLTIGIYAAWGMGKSFLMAKIAERMKALAQQKEERRSRDRQLGGHRRLWNWFGRRFSRPAPGSEPQEVGFHFVEFNAWVYSGSENLWAGLITRLYQEVEKHLSWRAPAFRLGQSFRRSIGRTLGLLAVYGLLGLLLSMLLDFNQVQESWDAARVAINALVGSAIGASALAGLRPLLDAIRDLFANVVLSRARRLKDLSSQPDFRDKIGFMADIKDEIRIISQLLKRGRGGRPTRLVIFIDDLDRCPPSKAVEVLEAIMLLLADEDGAPYVVFLGLDARVVVKAIEERYGKVLVAAGITGYEYLDKIVQIPFSIPMADVPALGRYVDSLLWRSEVDKREFEEAQRRGEQEALRPTGRQEEKELPGPETEATRSQLPEEVQEEVESVGLDQGPLEGGEEEGREGMKGREGRGGREGEGQA